MSSSTTSSRIPHLSALTLIALMLMVAACADEESASDDPGYSSSSGSAGDDIDLGSGGGGSTNGSGASGATNNSGGGDDTEPGPEGLNELGTLVVLGDSIGDGGGQGPYYYELLRASLQARYGAIEYVNNAQSGSKTSALLGQINSLPANLPGPVAVVITSGGNDMKDSLPMVLLGFDDGLVATMGANISAALDVLTAPNAFGTDVDVHVYEATIYDASDGQGNFGSGGCVVSFDSPNPVDPFFEKWNTEIANQVSDHGQALAPMHDYFYDHGFNNPPRWYANDCTHPNSIGHDQLQQLFYGLITGE